MDIVNKDLINTPQTKEGMEMVDLILDGKSRDQVVYFPQPENGYTPASVKPKSQSYDNAIALYNSKKQSGTLNEWIVPSNPNLFKADDALKNIGIVQWSAECMPKDVSVGDVVYLYISKTKMAVKWKLVVTEINVMVSVLDDGPFMVPPEPHFAPGEYYDGPFVYMEPICEYDVGNLLDYSRLKQHGLKSRIMSYLKVTPGLSYYINSVTDADDLTSYFEADADSLSTKDLAALAKKASGKAKATQAMVQQYARNAYIAAYAKRRANGICQLCGEPAPFSDSNGEPYLESHHIKWLSAGGDDSVDNTVALCPNCHRRMHIVKDKSDVKKLMEKTNA